MQCHLCGGEGKYQTKQGKWLCEPSSTMCPEVRKKNSLGVYKARADGKMSPDPFTEEGRKKSLETREGQLKAVPFEDQAWKRQRSTVIEEQGGRCLSCNNNEWLGKPINLQVDHIDGNNQNNKRENLRALCPNCHSYTDTYCGKNINKQRKYVPDELLIEEIKKGLSTRQVLINVGLTPKGLNYARVKKLAELHYQVPVKDEILVEEKVTKEKFDICCCGNKKEARNKHCSIKCARKNNSKMNWDSVNLEEILAKNEHNYSLVGRLLGVSDNAVRKRLKAITG